MVSQGLDETAKDLHTVSLRHSEKGTYFSLSSNGFLS